MRRRHRGPLPVPPPIGGIVIDGSNVIASGSGRATMRLDLAEAWFHACRPDLPIQVFIYNTTARRCRPEIQDELRARCMDVNPERARYAVTPRGEPADYYVLLHAQQHGSLVVSNDRFFDYEDLRANTITVHACDGEGDDAPRSGTGAARVARGARDGGCGGNGCAGQSWRNRDEAGARSGGGGGRAGGGLVGAAHRAGRARVADRRSRTGGGGRGCSCRCA
ncbi:MAG: hypothetical protein IT456_22065 [Planctomycetes bacterium]|nr:hypothetical protein [Planctomycetota bacterium]